MHDIDIQSMGGGGLRQLKPPHGGSLKCPRCDSLNTKFCYYNNYNLSQPRFFCKGCRRYWTKGGVLRNVPVGGGCRRKKTKRSKPISGSANPSTVAVKSSSGGSHSSSNNSFPATTTAPVAATTTNISVQETCFDIPVFDTDDSHHNMLSDIGMLKGLMTSSSDGLHIGMATSSMQQRGHEWVGGDAAAAAEGWGLFDDHQETYWWDDNNHHQLNYFP